jgi:hypothetical protein
MASKKPNRFTKPPTPIPETPLVASALALEGVDLSEQRKDRLAREAQIEEMETEIVEGAKEQARDMALWAETTPNSQDQARFFGNLTKWPRPYHGSWPKLNAANGKRRPLTWRLTMESDRQAVRAIMERMFEHPHERTEWHPNDLYDVEACYDQLEAYCKTIRWEAVDFVIDWTMKNRPIIEDPDDAVDVLTAYREAYDVPVATGGGVSAKMPMTHDYFTGGEP